nr:MFS transporter [Tardiphaga alba]
MVVTGAIASIAALFPTPAARARAFGITGVVGGIAMALGPTLGAAISATVGWRWIFFANVPVCLLVAVAIPRLIVEAEATARRPIQWAALAVLTAALGGIIEAFLLARDSLLLMAVGLVAAVVLFALFVKMQRGEASPMLDPVIFTSRPMGVAITLLIAVSIGYWALLVYLPPFLVRAYGWTHEGAGVALLATTLPMLLLPPVASYVVRNLGWRRLFGSALSCMAFGAVLLVIASSADAAMWGLVIALAGMGMIGAGAALVHPQLSGVVVELLPANASGMAAAVTVIARQGGFAIGVALLGAAMQPMQTASGFAGVFAIAALASALGCAACALLPSQQKTGKP